MSDKLEAWKAWCKQTSSNVGDDAFTLEKSSHGKAFSFAWDAATEAQQKRVEELEMNLDACASECLAARQMAKDVVSKNQNLFNALMESTKLSDDLYSKGHKLAFVLECILLATDSDMAAISKYWDEAHAALEEWRK